MADGEAAAEYNKLVRGPRGKDLRAKFDAVFPENLKSARARLTESLDSQAAHDALLANTAGAFGPVGPISAIEFLTIEPLAELNVKNFDVLFFQGSSSTAVPVQITANSADVTGKVRSALLASEKFTDKSSYLKDKLGLEFRRVEPVICVPSHLSERYADAIEVIETEIGTGAPALRLWHLNYFMRDRFLRLFTHFRSRHPRSYLHGDNALTRELTSGVRIQHGLRSTVFLSNSVATHAIALVTALVSRRVGDEREIRHLAESDVVRFFSDTVNFPHYAAKSLGPQIAKRVIDVGLRWEVFSPDHDGVSLTPAGSSPTTIIDSFATACFDAQATESATRNAKESAMAEFRKLNPGLGSFGD